MFALNRHYDGDRYSQSGYYNRNYYNGDPYNREPITSALVICQLLTAPLFAWFLELRSVAKQSARPIPPALGAKHHISLAETRMRGIHCLLAP
jgi:hypothetical protein